MPNWSPTRAVFARCLAGNRPDPALERLLRGWLAVGLLAVLLVPALRGSSAWLGWWPAVSRSKTAPSFSGCPAARCR